MVLRAQRVICSFRFCEICKPRHVILFGECGSKKKQPAGGRYCPGRNEDQPQRAPGTEVCKRGGGSDLKLRCLQCRSLKAEISAGMSDQTHNAVHGEPGEGAGHAPERLAEALWRREPVSRVERAAGRSRGRVK